MDARVTVPNAISLFRLAAAPGLVAAAAAGARVAFLITLGAALLSDAIDGPIARARQQTTDFGAWLDSTADCALQFCTPLAMLLLYPTLRSTDLLTALAILAAYAVPIAAGFIRFGRLTAYHTRLAKIAAFGLASGCLVWIAFENAWALRMAAVLLLVSGTEELAITIVLPEWRADVPSVAAARRLRLHCRG